MNRQTLVHGHEGLTPAPEFPQQSAIIEVTRAQDPSDSGYLVSRKRSRKPGRHTRVQDDPHAGPDAGLGGAWMGGQRLPGQLKDRDSMFSSDIRKVGKELI